MAVTHYWEMRSNWRLSFSSWKVCYQFTGLCVQFADCPTQYLDIYSIQDWPLFNWAMTTLIRDSLHGTAQYVTVQYVHVQWNLANPSLWNAAISLKQPVLQVLSQPVLKANGLVRSSEIQPPHYSFAGPKCGWNSEVLLPTQHTIDVCQYSSIVAIRSIFIWAENTIVYHLNWTHVCTT